MADRKPEKNEKESSEQSVPFADGRRNLLTVAVVGGLMLIEGVGIFVAVKYMGGGPASLSADQAIGGDGPGGAAPGQSELHVTDLVSFNNADGRVFVYQLSVYADVEAKHSQQIKDLIESRKNTIDDRFSKVVRAADPKYLDEPGLETMQRLFKFELDQILGDDTLIKEILFPEFSKSRAD